ncbi:hypothetical protein Cgig2_026440 [Carnegiea gigantea]|uniref:CCHC-type domain-containing protein n=1 Tax=Carnegiea gigantea TaxID=171969 RepID=A0A9Q1KQN6_9CARY|nr:hypothetical protein Cgig2_026440 [Carnegiea gigantea]
MGRGGRRGRLKTIAQPSSSPASPVHTQDSIEHIPGSIEAQEASLEIAQNGTLTSATVRPTYASLLDSNEGNLLNYVPATIINGKRCAQIAKEDAAQEVEYSQSVVLCSVLGANPSFEVIKGFINRIWAAYEIDKILMVKKGLFLVRFIHLQDKLTVERRGIYYFDKKPFLVKGWNPEMDLNTESIKFLPLWVQFPNLDIKYWGLESLSKLGSLLGIPLKTDRYTREKTMIKYARGPMEGPFLEYIKFFTEHGVLLRQQVVFEWKPSKCTHCGMYGHIEEDCRKKHHKKEWRWVQAPPQETAVNNDMPMPATSEEEGDFNAVLSKEDIIGGDPVTEQEIQELKPLLETCELQESPSVGAYFTWTNKTIWSHLDRILLNPYWHATFDYTQTKTLAMGLSDHTPLLLQFVPTPRPRPCFQYCEIWSKQPEFLKIGQQLKTRNALEEIQGALQQQPGDQHLLSLERQVKEHYISILASSLSLIE